MLLHYGIYSSDCRSASWMLLDYICSCFMRWNEQNFSICLNVKIAVFHSYEFNIGVLSCGSLGLVPLHDQIPYQKWLLVDWLNKRSLVSLASCSPTEERSVVAVWITEETTATTLIRILIGAMNYHDGRWTAMVYRCMMHGVSGETSRKPAFNVTSAQIRHITMGI